MWDDGLGGLYEMMGWVDGDDDDDDDDDGDDTLLLYLVITTSVKCGWFFIYSAHLSSLHVDCWKKHFPKIPGEEKMEPTMQGFLTWFGIKNHSPKCVQM